jgi:S1-C subfamily serine protease
MHQASLLQDWSQARSSLAAALAPGAVAIVPRRHRTVSGFRWREELIVTAAEALEGCEDPLVLRADGEERASVIACDLTTDVAVLRVAAGVGAVMAPAKAILEAGAGVIFAGRSRRGPLASFGSVRLAGPAWSSRRGGSIDQRLEFEGNPDGRFEGALVADFNGAAQAMLVAGPRSTLLGIPTATIERIVSTVQRHGHLPRPYLGLRLQALWLNSGRSLPVVAGVEADSPAQTAGLVPGDLLEAIDGVAVSDVEAVAARLAQASPGQELELQLRRGGRDQRVRIQVADWRRVKP